MIVAWCDYFKNPIQMHNLQITGDVANANENAV
jgi:hypothetical protein